MEQLLNVILIIVGVLVGIVGIVFLSRDTRRLRTVGVLIFPFMPAIILFIIIFPTASNASIEYLGKLGGPIAAYLIVALLARRFIEKDIQAEEKQARIEELQKSKETLEGEARQAKDRLQQLTKSYEELRESGERARPKPLPTGIDLRYYHPQDHKRQIVIRTGDISNVRDVDIIVNLE